jgi:FixJ family two-component response regulator
MKQPPTVFIVDNRPAITSALEATIKTHSFLVHCYSSAARFIADQDSSNVGCVLVDPLVAGEGRAVLRWLHESGSLLSVVLISGLIESAASGSSESRSAAVALEPHEESALLTMVTDGLAGSISRHVIRDRTRG